jgi:Tfp pilus assembly protein PilO
MMALVATARNNLSLTIMIGLALVLVIVGVTFFMGWRSAGELCNQLEQQEMTANIQLMTAQSNYDVSALQQELNELQTEIAMLKLEGKFPESAPMSSLSSAIANNAGWSGITLVSLSSPSKTGTEKIAGHTYSKTQVNMTVSGTLEGIQRFMASMEGGSFPTLVFESVNLAELEGGGGWEGDLTLAVVTQA